jgi:hypothetical protein
MQLPDYAENKLSMSHAQWRIQGFRLSGGTVSQPSLLPLPCPPLILKRGSEGPLTEKFSSYT